MPWSGMNPGFLQAIAGLGGLAQGYGQGQDQALQRALLQRKLEEQQREQQIKNQLGAALFGAGAQRPMAPMGGAPQMPGGGMPQTQPQTDPRISTLSAMGGGSDPQPFGGGPPDTVTRPPQSMGGGMAGQIPPAGTPQRQQLLDIIARGESGNRNIMQNVVPAGGGYNPSVGRVTGPSTAGGPYQITDTTWRETQAGQGYRRALDAPREVQDQAANELLDKRGLSPWAPYNKKLKADTDAFLKNMHNNLDLPQDFYKPAQQAANQIQNSVPMNARGTFTLDGLVEQINQRMPSADPAVKLAAMQFLMPLMQEQAKTEWDHYKFAVTEGRLSSESAERRREFDVAGARQERQFNVTAGEHQREFDIRRDDTQAQREWDRTKFGVTQDEHKREFDLRQGELRQNRADTRAYRQDSLDLRRDQMGAEKSADTQILTDPKNNEQYVYDKRARKATTLSGEPYTPGGAQKLGTRTPDGNALMTDEEAKLAGEQYLAGDRTALQGWGRGAQGDSNRVKIRKAITEQAKAKGWTGKDIAATMAEFEGTKAGERALGTREASLGMALAEAEQFAPLALEASDKVDRTQFPTINSLLIAGERGTGDENVVRLAVAVKSIAAAYSLVLTRGGVPTDAARMQANEILDTSYSKGQLAVAIDQMMKEIRAAKASPGQVRGQMREGITGRPQEKPTKLDGDGNVIQ